jgi:N-methylhydantoinase A
MLGTDLVAEHGRSVLLAPEELDPARARAWFAELEAAALDKMGLAAGQAGARRVGYEVDARFEGQSHELSVPVSGLDASALASVEKAFRERYREAYGIDPQGRVEFAALRVKLRVEVPRPPAAAGRRARSERAARTRPAYFGGAGFVAATALERTALEPGRVLPGPAILEGRVDTIVVPPGWSARSDDAGAVWLSPAE